VIRPADDGDAEVRVAREQHSSNTTAIALTSTA
jgi:hypothetical protein